MALARAAGCGRSGRGPRARHSLLAPLALAAVSALLALRCAQEPGATFVGGRVVPHLHFAQHRWLGRTISVGMGAGLLEDALKTVRNMGTDATNKAAEATLGMNMDEAQELLDKSRSGNIDFDDFMKASTLMTKAGGAAKMMNKLPVGGGLNDGKLEQAESRFEDYRKLIEGMKPEQRTKPDIFMGHDAEPQKARKELADKLGVPELVIENFITEFMAIRGLLTKTSSGKSLDVASQEIRAEIDQYKKGGVPVPRSERRIAKQKEKKKGGKTPEWMNL